MADGRFIAYYRVSTDRQGKSELGLEAQRKAVQVYLNGGNWKLVGEFTEVESGRFSDRPQLEAAKAAAKKLKATLVIAKLDRLARDVHFISGLMKSNIEFVAADYPTTDKFMLHIYAAVAEEEARKISQRTKAALEVAKARGVKLGWSNPNRTDGPQARLLGAAKGREKADQFGANIRPVIEAIRASGISTLEGIAQALNARGVKTARGGQWYPTTVKNVLARVS